MPIDTIVSQKYNLTELTGEAYLDEFHFFSLDAIIFFLSSVHWVRAASPICDFMPSSRLRLDGIFLVLGIFLGKIC